VSRLNVLTYKFTLARPPRCPACGNHFPEKATLFVHNLAFCLPCARADPLELRFALYMLRDARLRSHLCTSRGLWWFAPTTPFPPKSTAHDAYATLTGAYPILDEDTNTFTLVPANKET